MFDRAEPAIDAADELVDARAQVLVLFDILSRRNGELDEDDLCWSANRTTNEEGE